MKLPKKQLLIALVSVILCLCGYIAWIEYNARQFWEKRNTEHYAGMIISDVGRAISDYYQANGRFPSQEGEFAYIPSVLTSPVSYLKIQDEWNTYQTLDWVVDPYQKGNRVAQYSKATLRGTLPRYYSDGRTYAFCVSPGLNGVFDFNPQRLPGLKNITELKQYLAEVGVLMELVDHQDPWNRRGDIISGVVIDTLGRECFVNVGGIGIPDKDTNKITIQLNQ